MFVNYADEETFIQQFIYGNNYDMKILLHIETIYSNFLSWYIIR